MKKYFRLSGFTLIELIVAVAIVGIISAVAYPSYLQTVRKSNRAEAKAELTDAAARLQRCYTAYGKFNDSQCTVYAQLSATDAVYSRGNAYYQIAFATSPAVTATKYVLNATAVKLPQTKDIKDGCNVLSINQDGTRTPSVCW